MASFVWIKIKGLTWSNKLSEYVLWLMLSFLTDAWNFDYRNAVILVNTFRGFAHIVPFILRNVADYFHLPNYAMALLSSIVYTTGLGLLSLSATMDNCQKVEEDNSCSSFTRRYTFLFFLALPQLIVEELIKEVDHNEHSTTSKYWLRFFNIVALIGVRVVGVSNKLHQRCDNNSGTCYGHRLRCLDKAIINLPNNVDDDQELQNRVIRDHVEETKKAICRIPFCMAFFVLGIVSSAGDTYFIEQAFSMDNSVGHLKVHPVVFQLWYDLSEELIGELYWKIMQKLLKRNNVSSKYVGCVGLVVSMIFSILCCIAAANVDRRRLNKVSDLTVDDDLISMSMFWLVPQYFFLASFDGISDKSIDLFFKNHEDPTSSDRFMRVFCLLIVGFGKISSNLLVFVAQKVSEMVGGTRSSWFQEDINQSRLDKYYWVLAALTLANLVYYNILYYCTSFRAEVRALD
ncbi:hypothetical protein F8388_016286 [Cannabis sativa]|uniref:Uncharacterized protein n=2 Tax=Cannabis sativa TaxID=3483 RepID=A0A7J6DVU3_CANSA|nr:hypothetical protein F8388_016286 [Cannabis sativa]